MTDPNTPTCPSCLAPNKPGARFCGHCGQRLAMEPTQPIPVAPPVEPTQRIPVPLPVEPTQHIPVPHRTSQDTQPIPVLSAPSEARKPEQDEDPRLATQPGLTPPAQTPVPSPQVPAPAPALEPVLTIKAPADTPLPPPPPRRAPMWPWFLAGVALMGLLGGGFFYMATRSRDAKPPRPEPVAPPPAPVSVASEAPAELRPYFESAAAGDTKAMRMLGASYTYGLNVPVNREEGLRWYRKAAEAGDPTARQELQQLEGRP